MSWCAYRITLRQEAPLRVGWRSLGYVGRTRYYIPGRTIWGACTASMARNPGEYRPLGDELRVRGRFTYFFPRSAAIADSSGTVGWMAPRFESTDAGIGETAGDTATSSAAGLEDTGPQSTGPRSVRIHHGGLRFGSLDPADFEGSFLHSRSHTAICPSTDTRDEGSLYEMEYLGPTRMGTSEVPLEWVGYLFWSAEDHSGSGLLSLDRVWDALQRLFVGGELTTGMGWMEQTAVPELVGKEGEDVQVQDQRFRLSSNDRSEPSLQWVGNGPGYAFGHMRISEQRCSLTLAGDLEALVGRAWEESAHTRSGRGAGQRLEAFGWQSGSGPQADGSDRHEGSGAGSGVTHLWWVPGTRIECPPTVTRTLTLLPYGLLDLRTADPG